MAKRNRFFLRLVGIFTILGAVGTWMNVPEGRSILSHLKANLDLLNQTSQLPVPDNPSLLPNYDPYHPEHQEWWTATSGNYIFGEQFSFRLLPEGGVQRRVGATGQPVINSGDRWTQYRNAFGLDVRLERTIIVCFGTIGSEQDGIKGTCIDVQTQARTPWTFKRV